MSSYDESFGAYRVETGKKPDGEEFYYIDTRGPVRLVLKKGEHIIEEVYENGHHIAFLFCGAKGAKKKEEK